MNIEDGTLHVPDLNREVRSFISYAVGCMFGRYAPDKEGVVYAGGEWDVSKYASFVADKDNIIPICDDEYFEDDIVGLFVKFVKTVYGADTLDENLKFIADALGGKGQPKNVKLNKKLTTLQAQDAEIKAYEEKIHHLADQMISIDLDDGVKKNYAIFQDVLAKIK